MKSVSTAIAPVLGAGAAAALEAPRVLSDACPPNALGPAMQWQGSFGGRETELGRLTRELVMLGVAAQPPCGYCIDDHTALQPKR
ncbi:carboxymuconolactone decarboxylase family protein [Mangrovicoccus sp. HB161399]|uniref:carboxymuconolactone decarboxylase family protein n=1 Tax=Mangrovicoccus sp. HB161399 TaxID=2720392 RepID=UPI0015569210|nr:carboxymuconolactone decarboxylase family protein [Mangrovicoccus sp. HB161399]